MEVKKKRKVRIQETEDRRQNEKHWNSGGLEGWGKEIRRRQVTAV